MKKVLTIIILVVALQLAVVSATYAAPPAWGGGNYHHVMFGETLHSIGRMYNAAPQCLADANGIWDPNLIFAGEVLYIPTSCPPYPWNSGGHFPPPRPMPPKFPGYQPTGSWNCTIINCNWNSGQVHKPRPTPFYGYDYTGYYYGQGQDRYSHTCGFNNNCW